MLIRYGSLIDT